MSTQGKGSVLLIHWGMRDFHILGCLKLIAMEIWAFQVCDISKFNFKFSVFKGIPEKSGVDFWPKIENNGKKKSMHFWIAQVPHYRFGNVRHPGPYVSFCSRGVFMGGCAAALRIKNPFTKSIRVRSPIFCHNCHVIPLLLYKNKNYPSPFRGVTRGLPLWE